MRSVALIALTVCACLSAAAQDKTLQDGSVVVELPAGWHVWSEGQIATLQSESPLGFLVVGQGSLHPFGYPGLNPTLTLTRVDLVQTGQTGMSAEQLAQSQLGQMSREWRGFEPGASGVRPTALSGRPGAEWEGTLSLVVGDSFADLNVRQVVTVSGSTAHLLTSFTPSGDATAPPSPPDLPELPAPEPGIAEAPPEPSPTPPPPPVPAEPQMPEVPQSPDLAWRVGGLTLELPDGWESWNDAQVAAARRTMAGGPHTVVDVAGIRRVRTAEGTFTPSVAAEAIDWTVPPSAASLLSLCRESAEGTLAGTPSGELAAGPSATRLADRDAALATVRGSLLDHGALRGFRIDQVWVAEGTIAVRFVIVTDLGDDETRRTISEMLAGMTP